MKAKLLFTALAAFALTAVVTAKDKLPKEKDMAGYVMVYHKDADHGLHMAYSYDGYTWTALNGDKPIMAGDTIAEQKGIRDPYIFRAPDGAFCVAMTDLHVFGKRDGIRDTEWERDGRKYGWGNNRGLVLARSTDMIHWTRTNLDFTKLSCPMPVADEDGNRPSWKEVGCVWAPEMTATEDGRIMMHFTTRTGGGFNYIAYVMMSPDFSKMETEPRLLVNSSQDNQGKKMNIIDSDITKVGDTWHLFCVENGHPRHATAAALTGPYTFVPFDDGVPESHEAPMLWKLIGQNKWILMTDRYSMHPHNFYFVETTDLNTFKPLGYFDGKDCPLKRSNFSEQKHGAVVQVTKKELEKLIKHWEGK